MIRSFTALLLVLFALPASAAIRSFEVSQTALLEGQPTVIRTYARILDERNEPILSLDGASMSGSLGESELDLAGVQAFHASNEGVAYVFLVDISRSLSEREFALIQQSLENWIIGLRSQDQAAILAFGDESRLVVDFTSQVELLRESIHALGPTDSSTVLFEALQDGFELARRRDPDLPGRRALIVLTDGRDEGSGWSLEDILGMLRDDPVPIFAIGLSRIRDAGERQHYLQLLRRLSTNSGGAFFEGSTTSLIKTYAAIREAIHNVWVLDFTCLDCRRDGRSYRLQANLADGERVLSDGRMVRMLPATGAASSRPPGLDAPSKGTEPVVLEEPPDNEPPAAVDPDTDSGRGWLWLALPLLAAIAAGWLVWNRRVAAPISPKTDLGSLPAAEPVETPTYTTAGGIVTSRPPRPIKLRVVRLIVIRGQKPGRQYSVTLLDRAVVGARSTCDCVLINEPGVAPEQFELAQRDGHVFVGNLAAEQPTLLDGLKIEDQQRIQSEALVGTRDFIVRVIFGEGRATART